MATTPGPDTSFSSGSHNDWGETPRTSLSRPSTPLFKEVTHTNVKSDLKAIIDWLSEPDPASRFRITGLELEDLELLEKELDSAGRKIRHDWDRNPCVATFKMPCAIHETGGAWLSQHANHITDALQKPARCGQPRIVYGASSTVTTEEARREPDGQYNIRFSFEKGHEVGIRLPRVILETSYTQDNKEAIRKIEKYLCAPDSQVHAGIHVAMSGKITLKKDFSADIAVYVKKQKGYIIGEDYPYEEVAAHIAHEPAELSPELAKLMKEMEEWSEAGSEVEDALERESSSLQPTASESADGRRKAERPANADPHEAADTTLFLPSPLRKEGYGEDFGIECRGDRILLIDEKIPDLKQAVLPPLMLNVYDFLRPCPAHPDEFLANLEVPLDLNWLRTEIQSHLEMKRDDLRKALAVADVEQPTPDGNLPAHGLKRRTSDADEGPKKMRGARAGDFLKSMNSKPARR